MERRDVLLGSLGGLLGLATAKNSEAKSITGYATPLKPMKGGVLRLSTEVTADDLRKNPIIKDQAIYHLDRMAQFLVYGFAQRIMIQKESPETVVLNLFADDSIRRSGRISIYARAVVKGSEEIANSIDCLQTTIFDFTKEVSNHDFSQVENYLITKCKEHWSKKDYLEWIKLNSDENDLAYEYFGNGYIPHRELPKTIA